MLSNCLCECYSGLLLCLTWHTLPLLSKSWHAACQHAYTRTHVCTHTNTHTSKRRQHFTCTLHTPSPWTSAALLSWYSEKLPSNLIWGDRSTVNLATERDGERATEDKSEKEEFKMTVEMMCTLILVCLFTHPTFANLGHIVLSWQFSLLNAR